MNNGQRPGYPTRCACGTVLHTPKMAKFHRCPLRAGDTQQPRKDA